MMNWGCKSSDNLELEVEIASHTTLWELRKWRCGGFLQPNPS